jgi:hypothetical protein
VGAARHGLQERNELQAHDATMRRQAEEWRSMKRILCSLLVATLPLGSILADAPKSNNAKADPVPVP